MASDQNSKILVFRGTGYLGKYMVKASVFMGHPTFVYVRPVNHHHATPSKLQLHHEFQSMGVTPFQGELDEEEKMVAAMKQVDVVISTLAVPQHLEQFKIKNAIKQAPNISYAFSF